MQFSDKLIDKLKTEGTFDLVKNYIFEKTFVGKIIYYVTDWRYRSQSRNLNLWIINNSLLPDEVKEKVEPFRKLCELKKVKESLKFVNKHLSYKSDKEVWKVGEHWASAEETWKLKQDDCEGGSTLLYSILNYLDVSDDNLYITCGDVQEPFTNKEVGHCYLIWINPDDMQEYALDWCYYYSTSVNLNTPYQIRGLYYHGTKEWFRFNKSGSWTHRYLQNW
jgi:hypothetical protein